MPDTPQIIEFFGLPGIGKTTVARHVAEGLRQSGLPILSSHDAIGDDMTRVKKHLVRGRLILSELPSLVAKRSSFSRFYKANNQSLKARAKAFYNILTLTALQLKSERNRDILFLDQGMAQAAWSVLNFSNGEIAEARPVLPNKEDWAPLVVVLDAPLDLVIDRIGGRHSKHSRMQKPSANWARAREAERTVLSNLERLAKKDQLRVKRYSAEGKTPEALASQIVSDILSLRNFQS